MNTMIAHAMANGYMLKRTMRMAEEALNTGQSGYFHVATSFDAILSPKEQT